MIDSIQRIIGILFFLLQGLIAFSQYDVRGIITDINGETIIGAVVHSKDSKTAVETDFDGNYSLTINGNDSIFVTYLGYSTVKDFIVVEQEKVILRNYTMQEESNQLATVEIVAKQERANTYYMESLKKRSANSIDFVSAELMKKIGDSNISAGVARVTGVSTNGGFITVRGIGDRYVQTAINGAQIPTLDPFTNNIKLDIIPSSLVDNVIVSKTASADLPGDWTGAYISVETKDYPDKFNVNVETQVGYNPNTSFKSILSLTPSSTDWLGFDNNFRDRSHSAFVNYKPNPTEYEMMIALGMDDYYKSIGVYGDWKQNQPNVQQTYFNLGLVELGLLSKGDINNPVAIEAAREKFILEGYKNKAFAIINRPAFDAAQEFPNNWTSIKRRVTTNFSQSVSVGNQTKMWGKILGYIFGAKYTQGIQYDLSAVNQRILTSDIRDGAAIINENSNPAISRITNGWSALLNVAYKYHTNHSISLMAMPNFIGTNSLRDGNTILAGSQFDEIYGSSQFYEQRRQMVFQAKSEHFLPKQKIKIDGLASYTLGRSVAPDFKRYRFFSFDDSTYFYEGPAFADDPLTRDFRYLTENLLDTKLHIEIPLSKNETKNHKLKFGAAYKNLKRIYDQYNYELYFDKGTTFVEGKNLEAFFDLKKFSTNDGSNAELAYGNPDLDPNHNTGITSIGALYGLADINLTNRLRINTGIRLESTNLIVDANKYSEEKYYINDIRRIYEGALISNPGILKSVDFLPSLNFIYRIRNDEIYPSNLRINYSKSLARPSMREYSESIVYDFELRSDVFGNSNLKLVKVDNYDIRYENYLEGGHNFSISAFYKNLKNHIELIFLNSGFSWSNSDKSQVSGIELEGKYKITKNLDIATNVSLVRSSSKVVSYTLMLDVATRIQTWVPIDTFTRVMFGQAPVVVNGLINYNLEKLGLGMSLGYNYQAPRLVIQGNRFVDDLSKNLPDVYEMPRHLIDIKISKNISKKWSITLTIKDLLNSPIRRSYEYVDALGKRLGFFADYDRLKFGTNYLVSVNYKI
jgi:outer membrane receptor protein involved in Fe transport